MLDIVMQELGFTDEQKKGVKETLKEIKDIVSKFDSYEECYKKAFDITFNYCEELFDFDYKCITATIHNDNGKPDLGSLIGVETEDCGYEQFEDIDWQQI